MAEKPRFYWDACMWIALIKREHDRFEACRYLIEQAQRGEVEIWTSTFTYAEVYKRNCSNFLTGIEENDDQSFEDYIEQNFVNRIQVDSDVGRAARSLLRKYPTIGKPQDAIHVASALIENVHVLHTFDRADLLKLNGVLFCQDGLPLQILIPPNPPDPNKDTRFEGFSDSSGEHEVSKERKIGGT